MNPKVSAVVLSYKDEPWLERGVHALLASQGVDIDVVL
ncbi:MAG: glycosyltransferase family 2 protein, partial [Actinobacteria bacterium]|nr:glycosyltransferase family 2 protein [Actinomycetota bacterium]